MKLPKNTNPALVTSKDATRYLLQNVLVTRDLAVATDPDNLEGPPRTPEELAANARELDRIAPTPADKFALMLGLPTPWGFQLWQHLHREHGLTVTESQLQEIVSLAKRLDDAPEPDPMTGHPELPL